jgi:hypothetical protein
MKLGAVLLIQRHAFLTGKTSPTGKLMLGGRHLCQGAEWTVVGRPGRVYIPTQDAPLPAHDPGLVRASAFARCAKAAASARLGVPPVIALVSETKEEKQILFMLGTATEKFWIDVLSHYLGPARVLLNQVLAGNGLIGHPDALLKLDDETTLAVEIKFSNDERLQARQLRQIVAYLYAGNLARGYLILTHPSGRWQGLQVIDSGARYGVFYLDGQEYRQKSGPLSLPQSFIRTRVQTQRAALASGGVLGKLPLPELGQCVTSVRDGQAVVPICPWFCWASPPAAYYPQNRRHEVSFDGTTWLPLYQGGIR